MRRIKQIQDQCRNHPFSATANKIVAELIESYDKELIEVTAAADRLTDNVAQLQKERKRLEDEADALKEQNDQLRLRCLVQIIELSAFNGVEKARAIDKLYQTT